jgi:hypothetical protein
MINTSLQKFARYSVVGAALAASLSAQQPDVPRVPDLPQPLTCGIPDDQPLSTKDKACYWRSHTFNASMIVGTTLHAALAQWKKDPLEWDLRAKGYGKRVGTRLAQSSAKGTGQFIAGELLHEDPRFYASGKSGFGPRFWFAFSHSFIAKHDNGREWPALARMSGAVSSGLVGMACAPDSANTANQLWIHVGSAYAGHVASSLWKEFRPDILNIKKAALRRRTK